MQLQAHPAAAPMGNTGDDAARRTLGRPSVELGALARQSRQKMLDAQLSSRVDHEVCLGDQPLQRVELTLLTGGLKLLGPRRLSDPAVKSSHVGVGKIPLNPGRQAARLRPPDGRETERPPNGVACFHALAVNDRQGANSTASEFERNWASQPARAHQQNASLAELAQGWNTGGEVLLRRAFATCEVDSLLLATWAGRAFDPHDENPSLLLVALRDLLFDQASDHVDGAVGYRPPTRASKTRVSRNGRGEHPIRCGGIGRCRQSNPSGT